MKFIIFHGLKTKASALGYQTSIKLAYLLNVNVACLGFEKQIYHLLEDLKQTNFAFKLDYMTKSDFPEEQKESFIEIEKNLKIFNKTKNKSSKQIVSFQVIKKNFENIFDTFVQAQYRALDNAYNINLLRELFNDDDLYFYDTKDSDLIENGKPAITVVEILQLLLPDPEKGHPLFFLNIENEEYTNIMEVEIHNVDSEKAENRDCIYGEKGFTFPMLKWLSATETAHARNQLTKPTKEFREQLELWAEICYANPNTNMGLDYFRKNIQPLLISLEHKALESQLLRNTADYTNQNYQYQIIVGEIPIEKIWEIYKASETISEETFDELLQIKAEQHPKFEGRWPVVFLKSLPNPIDNILQIPESDTVQSVRKAIAID
jgi:hypothetical protein